MEGEESESITVKTNTLFFSPTTINVNMLKPKLLKLG